MSGRVPPEQAPQGAVGAMATRVCDFRPLARAMLEAEIQTWTIAQSEAARRLGIDRSSLNSILHGKRTVSLEALLSYLDLAGCRIELHLFAPSGDRTARVAEDPHH